MSKQNRALEIDYHIRRKTKMALRYRLRRRTWEVIRAIKTYLPNRIPSILDVGAADGLMLREVKRKFPQAKCIGVEYTESLIFTNKNVMIEMICGDAQHLPFKNECFDIAIATAVIEHVANPHEMLSEIYRVLIRRGILILTTPDPFWEHLATMIGHLPNEQHNEVMNLKELCLAFREFQFQILEADKFMLSPIGMPFELEVEAVIKKLGLQFLFANQIVVGRK